MHSRTSRSFSIMLALLAAFALVTGACSSDSDESADDSSGTESSDEGNGDSTESGSDSGDEDPDADTSTPGASADFSATLAEAQASVEGAEDACDLFLAVGGLQSVGNPETQEQTREAVDFYVTMLNKMADTSSDEKVAETLRTGASDFQSYAESVDYDPAKMDLAGSGPEIENADAVDEAMNTYADTEFLECEMPEGLAPEGTPTTPTE